MPNQRKPGKRLVGFYATAKERQLIQREARRLGITVSDLIKRVLSETIPQDIHPPKE